jgi:hypothetical protein
MAAIALMLVGTALAGEIKGTVAKVDDKAFTITVLIDGKEQTFKVNKDAEIYTQGKAKKNKAGPKNPVPGGLGSLKENTVITATTIKVQDNEIIAEIKVEGMKKKNK